jgi:hypothetical protein
VRKHCRWRCWPLTWSFCLELLSVGSHALAASKSSVRIQFNPQNLWYSCFWWIPILQSSFATIEFQLKLIFHSIQRPRLFSRFQLFNNSSQSNCTFNAVICLNSSVSMKSITQFFCVNDAIALSLFWWSLTTLNFDCLNCDVNYRAWCNNEMKWNDVNWVRKGIVEVLFDVMTLIGVKIKWKSTGPHRVETRKSLKATRNQDNAVDFQQNLKQHSFDFLHPSFQGLKNFSCFTLLPPPSNLTFKHRPFYPNPPSSPSQWRNQIV